MTTSVQGFSVVNHVGITVSNLENAIVFMKHSLVKKSLTKIKLAASVCRKRKA